MTAQHHRPHDHRGRFIPLECTDPDCDGKLVYESDRRFGDHWRCDGLVGPNDLEACTRTHFDGDPLNDHQRVKP